MKKVNIPQPQWPELAYFDGEAMHRIVPVVTKDGATYDISKHDARAEALVTQAVASKPGASVVKRPSAIAKFFGGGK